MSNDSERTDVDDTITPIQGPHRIAAPWNRHVRNLGPDIRLQPGETLRRYCARLWPRWQRVIDGLGQRHISWYEHTNDYACRICELMLISGLTLRYLEIEATNEEEYPREASISPEDSSVNDAESIRNLAATDPTTEKDLD